MVASIWPFAKLRAVSGWSRGPAQAARSLATSADRLPEHAGSASSTRHRLVHRNRRAVALGDFEDVYVTMRAAPGGRSGAIGRRRRDRSAPTQSPRDRSLRVRLGSDRRRRRGWSSEARLALAVPVGAQSGRGSGRSATMRTLNLCAPNLRRRRHPGVPGDERPAQCSTRTARQARCVSA
jgi:hypothetical protein